MNTAAKITVGVSTVAVLAGLTVLALPAVSFIGQATNGVRDTAETFASPVPVDLATAEPSRPPAPTEDTDYSSWSEADLAAAFAEQPHVGLINHPSRFAPGCMQNSDLMGGTLRGAKTLVDMGEREYASGDAVRDAEGALVGYTVAGGRGPRDW